jgi:4-amino-4-deoxy-L-arabinose transferase-like glycosyltransferase
MKIETNNKAAYVLKTLLFCLLIYFPIFLHLGTLPIRLWDESRLAINTYEMSKNGNYLVSFFEGSPDMWNTKPTLLLWLQVLCCKLIGTGELAIRLPSAIAAALTALALVLFSIKYFKDFWFGFIASLVLVTSYGYINVHGTRTGDYDSLLTLFITAFALLFFLYLENRNKIYLHFFFLAVFLAVMTKSIQGLLILPGLFIYLIIQKKFFVFKTKWVYIDLLFCVLAISTYYLTREHYNPGYLKAVWENELGGRYMTTVENHKADFMFYYNMLIDNHYANWYWLVPCGMVVGFFIKDEKTRKITLFSTLIAVTYWLLISYSKTKIEWYEMPLFPFLAMIVGVIIYAGFVFLKSSTDIARFFNFNVIPYIFLFVVFLSPYEKIIDKVYKPKEHDWDKEFYQISYFMKQAVSNKYSIKDHYLCYDGYNAPLLFYVNILNDANQNVDFKDWNNLQSGDKIIASQSYVRWFIETYYSYELLGAVDNIKLYKINGKVVVN